LNAAASSHTAYIGLGSNIDPEINIARALQKLREQTKVVCESSVWHSPALGTDGPDFLNAVVKIETPLDEEDLKARVLREIEHALGRRRVADKFAPRTIDLDTLIFDDIVLDEHIWEHAHLAIPVAECAPSVIHPATGRSIQFIANELQEGTAIRKIELQQK
jgi:2-amino-4-hydroxy-6-hydroxymethyldihydropteridine diphosphokinase